MGVGIVIVSHSARLAEGVVELAREMGGEDVRLEAAGGMADPPGAMGTDAERVRAAIERAGSGDGVLVLMDLGSALMSAEMATEMLEEPGEAVRLSAAPLVEGAVAAAAAARGGLSLDAVAAEARGGLRAKADQLGEPEGDGAGPEASGGTRPDAASALEVVLRLENRLGLHARPAARLVGIAAEHDAELTVENATTGRGPASARSLTSLALLGAQAGHELRVRVSGPQAQTALDAVLALAADGFGDGVDAAVTGGPPVSSAPPASPAPPASSALIAPAPAVPRAAPSPPPAGARLSGVAASAGIVSGLARRLGSPPPLALDAPAAPPDVEAARLTAALDGARTELDATRERIAVRAGGEEAEVFAAQGLLLADDALLGPARDAIAAGRTAARAFHDAAEDIAVGYEALEDPYLRERATDVRDVARRVLTHLGSASGPGTAAPSSLEGILVADELTPGEAAELNPARVTGVATARGSATAHAAILARALGLPAVVGLGDAVLAVGDGTPLLLDGAAGTVVVDPLLEEVREAEARGEVLIRRRAAARLGAGEPALTRDGTRIEVAANLGGAGDAADAVALGADGVGLLRTEFLFLGREDLPGEEEQLAAYAGLAAALVGRPLVIRTLDVGADKPLPGVPQAAEANPFLGERGIRLGLARPELLEPQLRAIARAAAEHPNVQVMFPMVATLAEYRAARAALERAGAPAGLPVGVMVEVPAVALQAERFAREVDFFSVGTNDLAQYTMAAERGNARLAALADGPLPPLLALLAAVGAGAAAHGRWVGVCGELAGDLDAVGLLVGLGITELSVAPPLVAEVKARVRELDLGEARVAAAAALEAEDAAAARALAAPAR